MRDRSREHSREKKATTYGTGKLHVSNLAFNVQESDVREEFERYFLNLDSLAPFKK